MRRSLVLVAALAVACGTLGSEELEDLPHPHGGVGPFRPLDGEETGTATGPQGRVLAVRQAVDNGMVTESGWLFYAAADPMEGATMPEDAPPTEVPWDLMEPRRIYRSEPGDEKAGFPSGEEVLSASEPWEGEEITDPWAVATPDGGAVRLYYVGDGGVGVAEASSVDGGFTRLAGPILEPEGDETIRRPSVVYHQGRWLMYYDAGDGRIGVAESADGVSFDRLVAALDLAEPPAEEGEVRELPPETGVGMPGVVAVTTPADRRVIRLYLESIREDGSVWISLAASLDGVEFDRLDRPVVEEEDRGDPAPYIVDDRTTLLYHTAPRVISGLQGRALVAGIAPRSVAIE